MKVKDNAVLKTVKEIEIQAPLDTVWKLQTDINSWDKWQSEISEAKLYGSLESGAKFRWKSGGFTLNSIIEKVELNKIIGWSGSGFGASAIHIWEFSTLENGNTLVQTSESMDGWLVKLLKGMMKKKLNKSLDTWLSALKKVAEKQ